jgi:membrane fusion protein, copper/silver efflux system
MQKALSAAIVLMLLSGAFLAGSWVTHRYSAAGGGRKILYYVDPMNPSHTSDKPGLAPCGMPMEPVYADDAESAAPRGTAAVPGAVKLTPVRQQVVGVRVGVAERKAVQQTLRLLGRVAADETRSFQVTAPSEGWITKAMPLTVGNPVKRDQTLALFYSPTFVSAGQAFRNALEYQDRMEADPEARAAQRPGLAQFNVKQYRESLRNLGVSDRQIDDMIRTRQYSEFIEVVAPADGFIVSRNVTQGQRFDKGFELYRIVDLSRVWILVDVFDNEDRQLKPGETVHVTMARRGVSLDARVSETLPQFDPGSRALKVRLEADNPGFRLRPDMSVDVELPGAVSTPLTVPSEAVIDTGLRKVVYLDRGDGLFEPRRVETGPRFGDRVEISKGLMEGERIVVSGNFLLDSESRMKAVAAGTDAATAEVDPICGMDVDPAKAKAANRTSVYQGKTYFFCSDHCKKTFDTEPAKYAHK